MGGRQALDYSVALVTCLLVVQAMGLSLVALVIGSLVAPVIGLLVVLVALVIGLLVVLLVVLVALVISLLVVLVNSLSSPVLTDRYGTPWSNGAGIPKSDLGHSFPAESACKMSKIKPSDKPKSSVYSKNGRKGLGIAGDHRTSLSLLLAFRCPELASPTAIDLSKVDICMLATVESSSQVSVKKHGQGQRSSGPAGGSGAGNAGGCIGGGGGGGDEMEIIGHGIGEGSRRGLSGGGQGQGNGDDDDNDGRRIVGNVENGRRTRNPTPEEIAAIFLPIIIQSVANIMSLNEAELSTTGRVIRYFSIIINSVGFICCAAVLWRPYTNPRVARILNPRISGILSRSGSALAVLGFISMMGIDLPLYLSWIMGLAFLVFLAFFLVDISEARQ